MKIYFEEREEKLKKLLVGQKLLIQVIQIKDKSEIKKIYKKAKFSNSRPSPQLLLVSISAVNVYITWDQNEKKNS